MLIPFLITFTIYEYDMFKFFFYALPLMGITSFYFLNSIYKKNRRVIYLSVLVLIFCSFTSINLLVHSYLNKSGAYSTLDYKAGIWIRDNTSKGSVFLTNPSIHSGVSDIAGRLRVLAFINWAYSHGFNTGDDNVFSRVEDINTFFKDPQNNKDILDKYYVDYVYYGSEERSNFPESENKLESVVFLKKIYENETVKIFERKK